MEAYESKLVIPISNIIGVNSVMLGDLHIKIQYRFITAIIITHNDFIKIILIIVILILLLYTSERVNLDFE